MDRRKPVSAFIAIAIAITLFRPASANGIDSRAYSCGGLQALVAQHGFVFISQATFGDFVVASRAFCTNGDILEVRSVATLDTPACAVNYCVSRDSGTLDR